MNRMQENIVEHIAARVSRYFSRRIFDIANRYAPNKLSRRDKAMIHLGRNIGNAMYQIQKEHEAKRPPQPIYVVNLANFPYFKQEDPFVVGHIDNVEYVN